MDLVFIPLFPGCMDSKPYTLFVSVSQDADADEDGFLSFEDFLTSYHKERPVVLSMLVMAAHAGAFYLVLNSPLELTLRVLLCIILLVKPAVGGWGA